MAKLQRYAHDFHSTFDKYCGYQTNREKTEALVSQYPFLQSVLDYADDRGKLYFMEMEYIQKLEQENDRLRQESSRESGWFVGNEISPSYKVQKGSCIILVFDRIIPLDTLPFAPDEYEPGNESYMTLASLAEALDSGQKVITVFEYFSCRHGRIHQCGMDGTSAWYTFPTGKMSLRWGF